jgi:hypothetical protein
LLSRCNIARSLTRLQAKNYFIGARLSRAIQSPSYWIRWRRAALEQEGLSPIARLVIGRLPERVGQKEERVATTKPICRCDARRPDLDKRTASRHNEDDDEGLCLSCVRDKKLGVDHLESERMV